MVELEGRVVYADLSKAEVQVLVREEKEFRYFSLTLLRGKKGGGTGGAYHRGKTDDRRGGKRIFGFCKLNTELQVFPIRGKRKGD